jgi:predicted acyltransferase
MTGPAVTAQPPGTRTDAAVARLMSLDVFRGFNIFAMILVNDAGDWANTYGPLLHATWEKITPTDLVFPFFLFIVGVALAAALRPYWTGERAPDRALYLRLARRAAVLIALGLLINGLPSLNVATWRIPGVLQRIGICFFLAAVILLRVPRRWQWVIGAAILGGYSALLLFVGAPGVAPGQIEPTANLPRWFELKVFSSAHVYTVWPTEPEGLLSTPSALVSVLLGCWTGMTVAGRVPTSRLGARIIVWGAVSAAIGWGLSPILPMVKMIWTPTYVLFANGWAMMAFGVCYILTDARHVANPVWPVQVFGRNAILAYVVSELAAIALSVVTVGGKPFSVFVTTALAGAAGGLMSMKMASLVYACLFTLTIWILLYVPYRRRWFIRV